jgi:1-acyl-sn-glycerol-3-phosphate acyltransferase
MAEAPQPGRRRPPPARLSPQALADAQGGAREGLDWLGRPPESRASLLVRVLRLVARFVCFVVLRFQVRTSGQEHLPKGGYLLVAAAHRGWMDPFVVMHGLPVEPRAWFLGSAPSTLTSHSRERLVRTLGGLLPVWRGGVTIDQHVESARAVVGNGGVFVQMPEGTVSGPAGTTGPFRIGWAVIALRTAAPIVPMAVAGTEELYVGRRMASRVLSVRTARDLAPDWDGVAPEPGSRAELDLARRMTKALEDVMRPVVEELHPWTVDPPDRRRLLRNRLTWLLLRPGRLDR